MYRYEASPNVISDYDRLNCKYVPMLKNVWGEVSTDVVYTPRQDDVGRMLHLEVRMIPEGHTKPDENAVAVCKDTSAVLPEPEAPPPRMMVYHPTANPNVGYQLAAILDFADSLGEVITDLLDIF